MGISTWVVEAASITLALLMGSIVCVVTVMFEHMTSSITAHSIVALSALWLGGACGFYLALATVGAKADGEGGQQ